MGRSLRRGYFPQEETSGRARSGAAEAEPGLLAVRLARGKDGAGKIRAVRRVGPALGFQRDAGMGTVRLAHMAEVGRGIEARGIVDLQAGFRGGQGQSDAGFSNALVSRAADSC